MTGRDWLRIGALSLGLAGCAWVAKSFSPPIFMLDEPLVPNEPRMLPAVLPSIDVDFLRCGFTTAPSFLAVQGTLSLAPRGISHSAVLIRHPQATFLFDTGLSGDIYLFMEHQSLYFRQVLARFTFERSLQSHLSNYNLEPRDLDFVFLSHLHWDHVSGVPDIPGVPLRINRVEYAALQHGLLEQHHGLARHLLGDANPIELFDCVDPAYEGFRSSFDLFGDGSVIAVSLPGHTPGHTGLLINRSNGSRLFLVGDAVWLSDHYQRPSTMHPFLWSNVTSDDPTARQTILSLYHFARRHPEIPLIAMHDAQVQETFMGIEHPQAVQHKEKSPSS